MQQFAVDKIEWGLDGYEVRFRVKDRDCPNMLAQPVEMKEQDKHMLSDPMMKLTEEGCMSLMDELWIVGIRPSERIIEPQNRDHMNGEIKWLRETADHLMKKP
jgi:hypothetical protein